MKFQNPSFKMFLKDGRTHRDGRTDKPKAICSPLFQSWGHNNSLLKLSLAHDLNLVMQNPPTHTNSGLKQFQKNGKVH